MKSRMKRMMTALLLTLVLAGGAQALETRDLVAIAAMPLAVAAVSEIAGVPTSDLVNVVIAMNRAAVPAPQFVEIVRYTPVALVEDTMNPPFVQYATAQYDNGLYGEAYAVSLAGRLKLYGVDQVNVVQPVMVTPAYVVRRDYVPAYVVTRVEQQRFDPLALVAMPLAVAAVSDLAGIPTNDLFSFIIALNRAAVPAPQFIEVVRYSPIAFLEPDRRFVTYVIDDVDRGIVGNALVRSIAGRYQVYGVPELDVVAPRRRVVVQRDEFFPPIVEQRYERVQPRDTWDRGRHPHGGPPGQLKRELGLQTGAAVVHGGPGVAVRSRSVAREDREVRTGVEATPVHRGKVKAKANAKRKPRAVSSGVRSPARQGSSLVSRSQGDRGNRLEHRPAEGRKSMKANRGAKHDGSSHGGRKGKGKKKG